MFSFVRQERLETCVGKMSLKGTEVGEWANCHYESRRNRRRKSTESTALQEQPIAPKV